MKTNKISNILNIVIFFLLIVTGFIIVIICPPDEQSIKNENKALAEMPEFNIHTVFSGDFTSKFETYLTDNVGFRSSFTDMNMHYDDIKGISYFGKLVKVKKDLGLDSSNDDADGDMKFLLILKDRIMEVFEKNRTARDDYIDAVNFYAEMLPENITIYNMIIPTQIEFADTKYAGVSDSQKDTIDYIYEHEDKRIQTINVYDILKAHKDEYIYFRTDHHWTALGAYYAASEFLKQTNRPGIDINDYIQNDLYGFFGFLYNQSGTKTLADNPDTLSYYTQYENENIQLFAKGDYQGELVDYTCNMYDLPGNEPPLYKVFLTGDHNFLHIPTNTKNGRSILIIKDSYANCFIPWLRNSYENIYVIDPRTYSESLDELFSEYDINEVLIFNYSFTTTFDDFSEMLKKVYE